MPGSAVSCGAILLARAASLISLDLSQILNESWILHLQALIATLPIQCLSEKKVCIKYISPGSCSSSYFLFTPSAVASVEAFTLMHRHSLKCEAPAAPWQQSVVDVCSKICTHKLEILSIFKLWQNHYVRAYTASTGFTNIPAPQMHLQSSCCPIWRNKLQFTQSSRGHGQRLLALKFHKLFLNAWMDFHEVKHQVSIKMPSFPNLMCVKQPIKTS